MNLHSIINAGDYGGLERGTVPESLHAAAATKAVRSAQSGQSPQALARFADHETSQPSSAERDKAQFKVRQARRSAPSTKARSPRRSGHAQLPSSPSRGGRNRRGGRRKGPPAGRVDTQAIADLYSVARGHQVSIMDVVLDSKSEARTGSSPSRDGGRLSSEELMDTLEERRRIALCDPSDDELLMEMFNPWWRGIRQDRLWRGTLVAPVDCSSSRIYRVSAERSTAAWDSPSDSQEGESSRSPQCTPY